MKGSFNHKMNVSVFLGSILNTLIVFLSVWLCIGFFNFSFAADSSSQSRINDIQKRIDNFQKLNPKEKQALMDEQNQLVQDQLEELQKQEVKLRRQRNRMIIQTGDVAKQERKLTTLFQEVGWQKTILTLLLLVLVLGAGVGWFAYRSYQQKQMFLEQEQAQKMLISEQKNKMESILQDVRDSIKYGLRIQNAVLPSGQKMSENLPGEYFIFSRPKDIVSGDFYFVETQGDWTLAAVADCTGHGVPGAFVSLLCISLLNETINSKGNLKANEILHALREQIIRLLQQKDDFGESRDGMDISLVLINKNNKEAQWAGANNPLFRYSIKEKNLLEYKPDKQPIGIYPKMKEFTNHKVDLDPGDVLYLFTDGYADQFGGEKGKKFMKRQLKKLLLDNATAEMPVQNSVLSEKLESWMGAKNQLQEQVDDITILGVKIC